MTIFHYFCELKFPSIGLELPESGRVTTQHDLSLQSIRLMANREIIADFKWAAH